MNATTAPIADAAHVALKEFSRAMNMDLRYMPNEIYDGIQFQLHPETLGQILTATRGSFPQVNLMDNTLIGFPFERNAYMKPGIVRVMFKVDVEAH